MKFSAGAALSLAMAILPATAVAQRSGDSLAFLARARRLHREMPMIDTHNDLPEMIHEQAKGDLSKMDPDGKLTIDTDIPRLKAGLVGGQFFAAYVPAAYKDKGPFDGSTRLGALSNVGYNQATFNLATMKQAGLQSPIVWLDVEPVPEFDWPADPTANAAVVRGAGFVSDGS